MKRIRIGAQLHPQHGEYAAIRDAVAAAEDSATTSSTTGTTSIRCTAIRMVSTSRAGPCSGRGPNRRRKSKSAPW